MNMARMTAMLALLGAAMTAGMANAQPAGGSTWQACASEGGVCRFSGTARVSYGAGKSWKTGTAANGINCNNQAFGGDPAPNQKKTCFVSLPWQPCASEGGVCRFAGSSNVAYGAGNQWRTRTFQNGANCTNAAFGGDPAPNVKKMCYLEGAAASSVSTRIDSRWSRCANESGVCRVNGVRSVAYGAQGKWVYRTVENGVNCTNAGFGRDPIPGVAKACFVEP
ncbi:MAG: hypothetical protein JNN20_03610 [Betaproteobacteria bacterium]|nr:hypothetical protein [Betaproteobacteria bacterium]